MASPLVASLSSPCELSKIVQRLRGTFFDAACSSVTGYRNSNEDAHSMSIFAPHPSTAKSPAAAAAASSSASQPPPPFSSRLAVFGVFDGHGGSNECSEHMAKELPHALVSAIYGAHASKKSGATIDELKAVIEETFQRVDRAFLDQILENMSARDRAHAYDNAAETYGTTAVVCIVEQISEHNHHPEKSNNINNRATSGETAATSPVALCLICNLGDSRCMVIREGTLHFTTIDQKPTDAVELRRINACPPQYHLENGRVSGTIAVARTLGDLPFKPERDPAKNPLSSVPVVDHVELFARDVLFLGCDGVFEGATYQPKQIAEHIYSRLQHQYHAINNNNNSGGGSDCNLFRFPHTSVVASEVCHRAVNAGSTDNVSCLLVRLHQDVNRDANSSNVLTEHHTFVHPAASNPFSGTSSSTFMSDLTAPSSTQSAFQSLLKDATDTSHSKTGAFLRGLVPQYPVASAAASAAVPATIHNNKNKNNKRGSHVSSSAASVPAQSTAPAAASVSPHFPPPLGIRDHFFIPGAVPDSEMSWGVFQLQAKLVSADPKRALLRRIQFLRRINAVGAAAAQQQLQQQRGRDNSGSSATPTKMMDCSTTRDNNNNSASFSDSLNEQQMHQMATVAMIESSSSILLKKNGSSESNSDNLTKAMSQTQMPCSPSGTTSPHPHFGSGSLMSDVVVSCLGNDCEFCPEEASLLAVEQTAMSIAVEYHRLLHMLQQIRDKQTADEEDAAAGRPQQQKGNGRQQQQECADPAIAAAAKSAAMRNDPANSISDEDYYNIFIQFVENSLLYDCHRHRSQPHSGPGSRVLPHQQQFAASGSHIRPFLGLDASANAAASGGAASPPGYGSTVFHSSSGYNNTHNNHHHNNNNPAASLSGHSMNSLVGGNLSYVAVQSTPGQSLNAGSAAQLLSQFQDQIGNNTVDDDNDDDDDDGDDNDANNGNNNGGGAVAARFPADRDDSDKLMDDNMASGRGIADAVASALKGSTIPQSESAESMEEDLDRPVRRK